MAEHPLDRLLAFLHGESASPEALAIEAHAAECAICREELDLLRRADAHLARTLQASPVAGFADRALARAAVADVPPLRRSRAARALVAAAAVVLLITGGWGVYQLATRQPSPPPGVDQIYILLLYQNVAELKSLSPEAGRARGQEYIDWARRLRAEGRYVSASRLRDTPGTIVVPGGEVKPGPPVAGDMSLTGYYIVRARDEAEATEIARAGPHPKYGTVVVRRVR